MNLSRMEIVKTLLRSSRSLYIERLIDTRLYMRVCLLRSADGLRPMLYRDAIFIISIGRWKRWRTHTTSEVDRRRWEKWRGEVVRDLAYYYYYYFNCCPLGSSVMGYTKRTRAFRQLERGVLKEGGLHAQDERRTGWEDFLTHIECVPEEDEPKKRKARVSHRKEQENKKRKREKDLYALYK